MEEILLCPECGSKEIKVLWADPKMVRLTCESCGVFLFVRKSHKFNDYNNSPDYEELFAEGE